MDRTMLDVKREELVKELIAVDQAIVETRQHLERLVGKRNMVQGGILTLDDLLQAPVPDASVNGHSEAVAAEAS